MKLQLLPSPVSLLAFTLIVLLLVFSFIVYSRWHFDYWKVRRVPGPRPSLLSGTFPQARAGQCNLLEELHEIYLQYKNKQRYVGIFTARTPKLFILDPQLAAQILTQHFSHFHDNESSQWTTPAVEQLRLCSPFVSTGEAWKKRRAELTPTMSSSRLRACHAAMQRCADRLVNYITEQPCVALDVKVLAHRFTAELMADLIWGIKEDTYTTTTQENSVAAMAAAIIKQSTRCVRYYGRTACLPWLRRLWPVRFFPAQADRFFQRLTQQAIQLHYDDMMTAQRSVVQHLQQLTEKKQLSDTRIAGHATTILIDGYETAAIVIAHCLLLLARNPRVQSKLRKELQVDGPLATYDTLMDLPYLDQCIQETLRLFPPLATLFKLCTRPMTLENHNDDATLQLQANDSVYISAYSFQRDSDYYERPDDYWPERFDEALGGVRKYRDQGVFLAFGDGPRQCPGMRLGLGEIKVAVASVVRSFNLRCDAATRRDNKIAAHSFLLTIDGDIKLHFDRLPN